MHAALEMLRRGCRQMPDLRREAGGKDRAEDRDAERAADRAEEGRGRGRNADREADRVRDIEAPRPEEAARQQRLDGATSLPDKERKQSDARDPEPNDRARAPRVLIATPRREQDKRSDAACEKCRAQIVDPMARRRRVQV